MNKVYVRDIVVISPSPSHPLPLTTHSLPHTHTHTHTHSLSARPMQESLTSQPTYDSFKACVTDLGFHSMDGVEQLGSCTCSDLSLQASLQMNQDTMQCWFVACCCLLSLASAGLHLVPCIICIVFVLWVAFVGCSRLDCAQSTADINCGETTTSTTETTSTPETTTTAFQLPRPCLDEVITPLSERVHGCWCCHT